MNTINVKLETLRTAAALYSKFDTIVTTLKNWEVVPPLGQLLDKIEKYLSKSWMHLNEARTKNPKNLRAITLILNST